MFENASILQKMPYQVVTQVSIRDEDPDGEYQITNEERELQLDINSYVRFILIYLIAMCTFHRNQAAWYELMDMDSLDETISFARKVPLN